VFEKIRQKTHKTNDEGITVRKLFRHYDTEGHGSVTIKEFRAALETLGCYFEEKEMNALFAKYDKDKSSKMDYEEFAGLIAHKGLCGSPVKTQFRMSREPPHGVLDKIKAKLREKGMLGMRSLIQIFKKFDTNGDNRLDRHEIQWLLKQNGHYLSEMEFETLFRYFDKNNDGSITVSELVRGIRGDLNEARRAVVDQAWRNMCYGDELEVDEFSMFYQHKMVSEPFSKVMADMDQNDDTIISYQEFVDYYTNMSPTFNEDNAFKEFLYSSWGMH